jgi:hypothetical protein
MNESIVKEISLNGDSLFEGSIGHSYKLFKKTKCMNIDDIDSDDDSDDLQNNYEDDDINVCQRELQKLDDDKMRCYILDCLAALL